MAFLRSFNIGNSYISFHALLLLRFYLAQFHFLGLLRLRYDRVGNAVRLTHYSVTISRMVALPFGYFLSVALLNPYRSLLYLQPYLFVCCLLWQPRHVHERRVRLINELLRLAPALYRIIRKQLKLSWLLLLQLALKFVTLKIYLRLLKLPSNKLKSFAFLLSFALPGTLSVLCLDMTTHLINIFFSLLLKSFEQLNTELENQFDALHVMTLHANYPAVRVRQRRLRQLKRLHLAYSRLTQELLDCVGPQLLLIVVYNITMIFSLSFPHWRRWLDILLVANGLRLLFQSLDGLALAVSSPLYNSWSHLANLLLFRQILAKHGWLHRRWYCSDFGSCGQRNRLVLLQPRLQVLGVFTPNRRIFFSILFGYCSFLYLSYMLNKRLPVTPGEIFNFLLF